MTEAEDGALRLATDAEVIRRSWREPELFAIVFDRHAPFIHRYAHRRVGRQAADDLVAETFLAAFGKRGRYDVSYPDARPWLYGIATNFVNRHRREEVRQYRIRLAALPDLDVPGHAERVAAEVTARDMRGLLLSAVARLRSAERDVLILVAREGLTYDEAAQALGIPVGTVRSRLSRAKATIREVLAAAGHSNVFGEIAGDVRD
jgi:RNA polymerase sigma factor (sigma-70 family)